MKQTILLSADEGMILTDGESYCKHIYLAETASAEDWHEIPEEEHAKILEEQMSLFSDSNE